MNEPDRRVLMLTLAILGIVSLVGLVLVWSLLRNDDDAASLIGLVGSAITALGLVATRGSRQGAAGASEAVGYQRAVEDLKSLAPEPGSDWNVVTTKATRTAPPPEG